MCVTVLAVGTVPRSVDVVPSPQSTTTRGGRLFDPIVGVTVSVTGVVIGAEVGDTATLMLFAPEAVTVAAVLVFDPAVAVTDAFLLVVSSTRASPLASVVAIDDDSTPAV